MRRIAQDDGFSLLPGKNCQRMTEHLQFPTFAIGNPEFCFNREPISLFTIRHLFYKVYNI